MSELSFGDRITFTRYKKKLSIHQLAEAVGSSDRDITAWESGKGEPTLNQAGKLSLTLGYPVSYFSTGDYTGLYGNIAQEELSFLKRKELIAFVSKYWPDNHQEIVSKIEFDNGKAYALHSDILSLDNYDFYVALRSHVKYYTIWKSPLNIGGGTRNDVGYLSLEEAKVRRNPKFIELALEEDPNATEADKEYYRGGKVDVLIEKLDDVDEEELRKLIAEALMEIKELKHSLGNLKKDHEGLKKYVHSNLLL